MFLTKYSSKNLILKDEYLDLYEEYNELSEKVEILFPETIFKQNNPIYISNEI